MKNTFCCKRIIHPVFILLGCFWLSQAQARQYSTEIIINSTEELYALLQSGELQDEEVELLVALYQRPLDINRADRIMLFDLPTLSYELADKVIQYRAQHGGFKAKEDLLQIDGIDASIFAAIKPFIKVDKTTTPEPEVVPMFRGRAVMGTLWRKGFIASGDSARNTNTIDETKERASGPQAYLRFDTQGLTYFGAGGLMTFRRRTNALWDYSTGYLVSDGPENIPDLDQLYLWGGFGQWSVILGSYNVGFGERLTFDRTVHRDPHGWYENTIISEDNSSGRLRPRPGLFGGAISLNNLSFPAGWLDVTGFASYQKKDVYQYDFNYGFDPWYGSSNVCETNGDCPDGYSCGDDNVCYSSSIYDKKDMDTKYTYETLKDAYTEILVGGNTTWFLNESSHVGITGYTSSAEFSLAEPANPSFKESANYPTNNKASAIGVNGRWGMGPAEVSGEYALSASGGMGMYLRGILDATQWAELSLSLRHFDPKFENPYARVEAADDEAYGQRARNEQGVRFDAMLRPIKRLRLTTTINTWQNPYENEITPDGIEWTLAAKPVQDLKFRQRASYGITSKDYVYALVQYDNKDLSKNSRDESYALGDYYGAGEKRRLQFGARTARIRNLRINFNYTWAWEDVSKYEKKLDLEQSMRLRISWKPLQKTFVIAYFSMWFHDIEFTTTSRSDREKPKEQAYLEVRQGINDLLSVNMRYGVSHFKDERPERYNMYHLAKVALVAKF